MRVNEHATTGPPVRRRAAGLATAVRFLTRLPVPRTSQPAGLGAALGWFPLVGVVVAAPAIAARALGAWGWSPLVGGVLAVATGMAVTGAFHEDGLADTVDGLWGGWTVERRLAIMHDSRLGTYGASALLVAVLLEAAFLASMSTADAARALLVGHVVGRASVLPLVRVFPAARDDGHGARIARPPTAGAWALACLTVAVAGVVALGAWLPLVLVVSAPAPWMIARTSQRRVGGITGDVLGAANVLAQVSVLAVVAAVAGRDGFGPGTDLWGGLW